MQRDKDSQTDEGGRAGTYRDTAVCSHRFNVFVLQNLFFYSVVLAAPWSSYRSAIVFIKIYMF